MTTWRKILAAAALLGAGLMLSQCGEPSATVRYRVIATAEVDGQRVEGSTVMEVNYQRVKHSLIGAGGATQLYGEALILDLKGGGTVFLLPVWYHEKTELVQLYEFGILRTFGVKNSVGGLEDDDFARLRQAKGRKPLSPRLPLFVAFKDEKIPNTIYEVDPQHMGSAFPAVRFIGLDIQHPAAPVPKVLKKGEQRRDRNNGLSGWDREPPGKLRAEKDQPLGYKS